MSTGHETDGFGNPVRPRMPTPEEMVRQVRPAPIAQQSPLSFETLNKLIETLSNCMEAQAQIIVMQSKKIADLAAMLEPEEEQAEKMRGTL